MDKYYELPTPVAQENPSRCTEHLLSSVQLSAVNDMPRRQAASQKQHIVTSVANPLHPSPPVFVCTGNLLLVRQVIQQQPRDGFFRSPSPM